MNRTRKIAVGGALAASTLLGGGIGAALLNGAASAQTNTPTTEAPSTTDPSQQSPDRSKGGHTANGVTETLLTGGTAAKVEAAALAAVPGGTVERVENDAEGSPYEAHMTNAEGNRVTVKLDSNFTVTSVEDGRR